MDANKLKVGERYLFITNGDNRLREGTVAQISPGGRHVRMDSLVGNPEWINLGQFTIVEKLDDGPAAAAPTVLPDPPTGTDSGNATDATGAPTNLPPAS